MSPLPTATREKHDARDDHPVPYPALDLLVAPSLEIVVDWQMQSDSERKA